MPRELLQAIARGRAEILHLLRGIHDEQLAEHDLLQLRRISPHAFPGKQALRVGISEALDHPG
jgi:hypothetical protein